MPDTVWGPAWVAWRQGDDFVGWTPLPPDQIAYDVDTAADLWTFVPMSAFVRPDIRSYVFSREEARERFRASHYEGRTRVQSDARVGSDHVIDPHLVAGSSERPLHPYEIRPRLFPGTIGQIGHRPVFGGPGDQGRGEHVRQNGGPIEPLPRQRIEPAEQRQPEVAPRPGIVTVPEASPRWPVQTDNAVP